MVFFFFLPLLLNTALLYFMTGDTFVVFMYTCCMSVTHMIKQSSNIVQITAIATIAIVIYQAYIVCWKKGTGLILYHKAL